MNGRVVSYAPVYRSDAKALILGSAPSVQSLKRGFYYAHPQNAFWKILHEVLGAQAPSDMEGKKALLLSNGIALWDVARSCVREGSLDADMRDVKPNDIPWLVGECPGIRRVLINGGTAFALYKRHFRAVDLPVVRLPSTSPAYTLNYQKKLEAWREALLGAGDL